MPELLVPHAIDIPEYLPSPRGTKADETSILCHVAPAGALVRQHAEHHQANHSCSLIWLTVSSSAPSLTHLLSHHASGPDLGAEHARASINSPALGYIYGKTLMFATFGEGAVWRREERGARSGAADVSSEEVCSW